MQFKGDTLNHPSSNFGDLNNLPFKDLSAGGSEIISTRVRLGRTVEGYAFGPYLSKEDRLKLEKQVGFDELIDY